MIKKERKEYLLNNLLLFMKNEMEDIGRTKDTYWFVEKFSEEVYYMGVNEPRLEPASEDTAKFISKYPCEKKELEVVIKYAITHELLERFMQNSYKITYLGIDKADKYEEYLEKCVSDNQIILNDYIESPDNKVNEKIIKCRNLYLTNDIDGALENIWDAFERLKTIYANIDKKASIKKICENCATSLDFDNINSAFEELTYIGNNYQIRHFETNKKQITDNNTKVYLYFRMLTLITFAIKQLEVEKNDL